MLGIILFIAIIFFLVLSLIFYIKHRLFCKYVLENFKTNSCCVYGKKRKGKGCVTQWVINKRHDLYYSNISFGGKYKHVSLKDCSVSPNTYVELMLDSPTKVKRQFFEGKDIYIDDIYNIAPAIMHNKLWKDYPSLPIFQSLSGHLYDNRFHCNAQRLGDIWLPIRSQSDFFVWCRGTTKILGFIFVTRVITYEKLESAEQCLFPLKKLHFNKYNKADYQRYYAVNGEIKQGRIINFKWNLKYDSRAYEKILLKGKRKYYKKRK